MSFIGDRLAAAAEKAERDARKEFEKIDSVERVCTERVLRQFAANRVSEAHLLTTTGYGYGDLGRDTLDSVYAGVYGTEDALVRVQFVSGTHAIATALSAVMRPGSRVLCPTGALYDTIQPAVKELSANGVRFEFTDFSGRLDRDMIAARAADFDVIYIQRSRGYSTRRSLRAEEISEIYGPVHSANPNAVIFVDNCYGEFVCETEPKADLIAGSLIKNAGGGLCACGGYIVGNTDLVERCADRLFAPGLGKHVGPSLNANRSFYEGLFMAPHATAQALKTAVFAASLMKNLGYEVTPEYDEPRGDIVQLLMLRSPEKLCAFCRGLQSGSPVDSHVTPEPWDMPGYDSQIIMAAGGFISGASSEISADAPLREPYCVFLQGGLTYQSGKYAVLKAAAEVLKLEQRLS